MPGPEVDVIARAPAQPAPIAIPIAASSSSAWTIEMRFSPVFGPVRNLAAYAVRFSQTDDGAVIGYQAAAGTPPIRAPSAAPWFPSTSPLPSAFPVIGSSR